MAARPIFIIASDIRKTWTKVSPYAQPYLEAMSELNSMHCSMKLPEIGDEIYIPSAYYLGHGADDVQGGKTTITEVFRNDALPHDHINSIFVTVEAINPATKYNYKALLEKQDDLKIQFGNQDAKPDPDYRREFNTGW
jgi:hypothetical protein